MLYEHKFGETVDAEPDSDEASAAPTIQTENLQTVAHLCHLFSHNTFVCVSR